MRRVSTRGSALAAALVVVILSAGLVAALATYSFPYIRTSSSFNQKVYALYASEAYLEEVRYQVANSQYDSMGNLWLMNNSSPPSGAGGAILETDGYLAFSNVKVGEATVNVRVVDLGNSYYRITSTAQFADRAVSLAQEIRARDTFARYLFFVDVDNLSVGTTTVRGSVYSGKKLINNWGGAKYYKSVETRMGVVYQNGATAQNTKYFDTTNWSAPQVKIPSTNEIATLHNNITNPVYWVENQSSAYSGGGAMNTDIVLMGNQVKITAKKKTTGAIFKTGTYPIPDNGLIFVQGDVTSLSGDISGRLTIATMGQVNVTGKIRYKDPEGDLAYVLQKNGVNVPNNDDGTTTAWNEPTYKYVKNPAYNPDSDASPTLGVLAAKDVVIANSAPYNMEVHGALFSATGRWYCDLTQKKGNWRFLGSMVQNLGGWRYNGATLAGYGKSGEYIYDTQLQQTPPPFYLPVDKPIYGPRWELSSK